MTFNDITRQTAWTRQVQFKIKSVGEPEETQYGFCQAVSAEDERGHLAVLNYFYEQPEGGIDPSETGEQFYDVKWDRKNLYYKCIPATPPPKDVAPSTTPDWDKINLGKCRHGILCAILQSGWSPESIYHDIDQQHVINKLAKFSMNGSIPLDND